ncbi:MAG TPA: hypothetical protein GXX70_00485 [Tepidimicrobium sp.]|nr:hypothetical protein [Tepidimicrobium sp.]
MTTRPSYIRLLEDGILLERVERAKEHHLWGHRLQFDICSLALSTLSNNIPSSNSLI